MTAANPDTSKNHLNPQAAAASTTVEAASTAQANRTADDQLINRVDQELAKLEATLSDAKTQIGVDDYPPAVQTKPAGPAGEPADSPAPARPEGVSGDAAAPSDTEPQAGPQESGNTRTAETSQILAQNQTEPPQPTVGMPLIPRLAAVALAVLVTLDRPFAGLSMPVKSFLGYVGIATLVVALGTWIVGASMRSP